MGFCCHEEKNDFYKENIFLFYTSTSCLMSDEIKLQRNIYLIHHNIYSFLKGWIAKMKLSDMSQLDDLMDEAAYDAYVKESEEE